MQVLFPKCLFTAGMKKKKEHKGLQDNFSYVETWGFGFSHIEVIVVSKVPFRIKYVCAELGIE